MRHKQWAHTYVCVESLQTDKGCIRFVQPWTTNLSLLHILAGDHVTCWAAEGVTAFICQKSHSSRETTVTLAAAEAFSEPCLALFKPSFPRQNIRPSSAIWGSCQQRDGWGQAEEGATERQGHKIILLRLIPARPLNICAKLEHLNYLFL